MILSRWIYWFRGRSPAEVLVALTGVEATGLLGTMSIDAQRRLIGAHAPLLGGTLQAYDITPPVPGRTVYRSLRRVPHSKGPL